MGLGWFWAIWDRDAQAWHDKIVNTVVLHRRTESRKTLVLFFVAIGLFVCIMLAKRLGNLSGLPLATHANSNSAVEPSSPKNTGGKRTHANELPSVVVLGFRAGESPADMGKRAGSLGFQLGDCKKRADDAPEYVDCKLSRANGDDLTMSFLDGRLQRISLDFRIENYDNVLKALERDDGMPRHGDDGGYYWGSPSEGFDITLDKTYDKSNGFVNATFTPEEQLKVR